jgi:thiosulfate/3-mercaptopyruvate sulfurtransferase
MTADPFPPLVDAAWLEERLDDPDLRVFDCTGVLVPDRRKIFRSESGRPRYDEGHVPGAGYLDLHGELSDPAARVVYTVPPAERFADAMSRHGVGPGTRVVLYGKDGPSWATRVWWLLRLFGFDEVALLDGGWERWVAEGRPVSRDPARYAPSRFAARPRPRLLADKAEVAEKIGSDRVCLLNSLVPEHHAGTGDPGSGSLGHIPGSSNLRYTALLHPEDGTFLPPDELRRRLAAVGALDAPEVVTYCTGGIGATALAFALALVGREDVAVYDGSMLEWSADPSRPVERGAP